MIGVGAANISAGFLQGFAVSTSGSRTAVAEQSGAKSQLTGVVGAGVVAVLLLFLNRCSPTSRSRRSPRWSSPRRCRCWTSTRSAATVAVRPSALLLSLAATVGVIVFGVLEGIVVAIVLSVLMFFRRSWWPHGAVLGHVEGLDGWHNVDDYPAAGRGPGRRRVPLGGAALLRQRRSVPRPDPPAGPRGAIRSGSCWCARRSPTSTSPPPACSSSSTASSTTTASTWRSSRCAPGCRISSRSTGSWPTLDDDHFYPTIDQAVTAIDRHET